MKEMECSHQIGEDAGPSPDMSKSRINLCFPFVSLFFYKSITKKNRKESNIYEEIGGDNVREWRR